MSVFGGIISIFDWLKNKLPIQDRKERWKNELDNLNKEKQALLKGSPSDKAARRVDAINKRIDTIQQWLRNQTST